GTIMRRTLDADTPRPAPAMHYPRATRGLFFNAEGRQVVPDLLERMNAEHVASQPFRLSADPGRSGDGYNLDETWGRYGAGGVAIRHVDAAGVPRVLIMKSGLGYSQSNWQLPGCAMHSNEKPAEGVAREVVEELGLTEDDLALLVLQGTYTT